MSAGDCSPVTTPDGDYYSILGVLDASFFLSIFFVLTKSVPFSPRNASPLFLQMGVCLSLFFLGLRYFVPSHPPAHPVSGIPSNCSQEQIRNAYKVLALRWFAPAHKNTHAHTSTCPHTHTQAPTCIRTQADQCGAVLSRRAPKMATAMCGPWQKHERANVSRKQ